MVVPGARSGCDEIDLGGRISVWRQLGESRRQRVVPFLGCGDLLPRLLDLNRMANEVAAALDAEFRLEACELGFDGLDAAILNLRDFEGAEAQSEQMQHFGFPFADTRGRGSAGAA